MRSGGLGDSVSELMIGKKKTITRNCTQYCLTWVFVPFVHVVFEYVSHVLPLVLSCLVCTVVGLAVCIVVVVLCVLLLVVLCVLL